MTSAELESLYKAGNAISHLGGLMTVYNAGYCSGASIATTTGMIYSTTQSAPAVAPVPPIHAARKG
jgi:formylmethanofuran:tetrahydromethanopterin formyltransferase